MAATNTAVNACDAVIKVDDENGVLKDISGSTNEVNLSLEKKTGEVKVFGTDWPIRMTCGRDGQLELTIVYSTGLEEGKDILNEWFFGPLNNARTVQVILPEAGAGSDIYYGEYVLTNYEPFGAKADEATPIMVKATLKPHRQLDYAKSGS